MVTCCGLTIMSNQETEIITLIDLAAVLLRYRRMVVVGTLAVVAVYSALFVVIPFMGVDLGPGPTFAVEKRIRVRPINPNLAEAVTVSTGSTLSSMLKDVPLVVECYEAAAARDGSPAINQRSRSRLFDSVNRDMIEGRYAVEYKHATQSVIVRYETLDLEFGAALLEEVAIKGSETLAEFVDDNVRQSIKSTRLTVDETKTEVNAVIIESIGNAIPDLAANSTSGQRVLDEFASDWVDRLSPFADARQTLSRLEELQTQTSTLAVPDEGVSVYEQPGRSPIRALVVLTVVAFLFFLILAFVLDYGRRVRSDPEEMTKIRSAWNRTD